MNDNAPADARRGHALAGPRIAPGAIWPYN